VLVSSHDCVKLADFGLSRLIETDTYYKVGPTVREYLLKLKMVIACSSGVLKRAFLFFLLIDNLAKIRFRKLAEKICHIANN